MHPIFERSHVTKCNAYHTANSVWTAIVLLVFVILLYTDGIKHSIFREHEMKQFT